MVEAVAQHVLSLLVPDDVYCQHVWSEPQCLFLNDCVQREVVVWPCVQEEEDDGAVRYAVVCQFGVEPVRRQSLYQVGWGRLCPRCLAQPVERQCLVGVVGGGA